MKDFNNRIKDNIKKIKKLPKIRGVKEIMYPGQNKYLRYKFNSKKNIVMSKKTIKEIEELLDN